MTNHCGNIADNLLSVGQNDAPALHYRDETTTYARLRARVSGVAGDLLGRGVSLGDKVGLFSENGSFFAAGYLGVIRAAACVVPFQVDCNRQTFRSIVASTGMTTLFVSRRYVPIIGPWAEELSLEVVIEGNESLCAKAEDVVAPPIDPDRDLAAIMFTSGSTGPAKGVMVTHRNIQCNTRDIVRYMGLTAQDRVMAVLPFYYCYGASLLHTHLAVGGSVVVNNRFMFPEKVLDQFEQQRCTGFAGVPSTYQILLRKTRFAQRRFPALRWFQQAGGRLPDPFIREIREAFPEVDFYLMYGQTEGTARLSYLPPERLADKLGSIGRGLPSTRLAVLQPDGVHVAPGSGQVGEIVASGDNVAPGYWKDPEETEKFFRDGKLYTGDLARVDEDGFIYVVERSRDFIKSMGHRVSSKEVEAVVAELPEVVEVAVIGVPHDTYGEAIKAYVATARPNQLTRDAVRNHCLKHLPNYKIPEYIEFMPSLPKTVAGKVDKVRLKESAKKGS